MVLNWAYRAYQIVVFCQVSEKHVNYSFTRTISFYRENGKRNQEQEQIRKGFCSFKGLAKFD